MLGCFVATNASSGGLNNVSAELQVLVYRRCESGGCEQYLGLFRACKLFRSRVMLCFTRAQATLVASWRCYAPAVGGETSPQPGLLQSNLCSYIGTYSNSATYSF